MLDSYDWIVTYYDLWHNIDMSHGTLSQIYTKSIKLIVR